MDAPDADRTCPKPVAEREANTRATNAGVDDLSERLIAKVNERRRLWGSGLTRGRRRNKWSCLRAADKRSCPCPNPTICHLLDRDSLNERENGSDDHQKDTAPPCDRIVHGDLVSAQP
jgi:hypothetical protein